MKIKKIQDKLNFDVEVQDKCPQHGNTRWWASCSSDCALTVWNGMNAWFIDTDADWSEFCKKETTYSCATLCIW